MSETPQALAIRALSTAVRVDGCLHPTLWRTKPNGYVRVSIGEQRVGLHRVVMEAHLGRPLATEETIDHECHNSALAAGTCVGGDGCPHRRCIDVTHLSVKSRVQNYLDGPGTYGARTEACLHGHPWNDVNTIWRKTGRRTCRSCGNARAAGRDPSVEPLVTAVRAYHRHAPSLERTPE